MSDSVCRIGLVGVGTIGAGIVECLSQRRDLLLRRSGVEVILGKVADVDRQKALDAGVPEADLVDDYEAVVRDADTDIVVELVGGTGVAHDIVRAALEAGKPVVTANKALLAERGAELFSIAEKRDL